MGSAATKGPVGCSEVYSFWRNVRPRGDLLERGISSAYIEGYGNGRRLSHGKGGSAPVDLTEV